MNKLIVAVLIVLSTVATASAEDKLTCVHIGRTTICTKN